MENIIRKAVHYLAISNCSEEGKGFSFLIACMQIEKFQKAEEMRMSKCFLAEPSALESIFSFINCATAYLLICS